MPDTASRTNDAPADSNCPHPPRARRGCLRAERLRRRRDRRRSAEGAARRVHERGDELRSAVLRRRGDRRHHRSHLRVDAGLRLPRPPGEARAAHAGRDADRRGWRRHVHVPAEAGNHFTPDPGVQGQAARAHGRRPGLRVEAPARSGGQEPVAVAASRARSIGATKPARRHCKPESSITTRRLPGIEVVDRYTLRIRLKEPDLRFLYAFAIPNTAAVAREVVEAYGYDIGAHPVGTGPYMLAEYRRSSKIELVANPGYRDDDIRSGRAGAAGIRIDRGRARGPKASVSPAGSRSRSSRRARPCGSRSLKRELDLLDRPSRELRRRGARPAASCGPSSPRRASGTRSCCGRTRAGRTSTWRTRSSAATRRKRSRCAARSAWATTSTSTSA